MSHPASFPDHSRPFRELLYPDVEAPLPSNPRTRERRRCNRYHRRLKAMLITGDTEQPVTCTDLGYGGMRVLLPPTASPTKDQHVSVRLTVGKSTFADDFTVVAAHPTPDGTAAHLAL